MNNLHVRHAMAGDLGLLSAWLGHEAVLPSTPAERLWVAEAPTQETGGQNALLGCLRLVPAVGLVLPRVSYHVGCTVHSALELGLHHRQRTLLLGHDHTGASELTDIAWLREEQPLAEQAEALQHLLAVALLHVAQHRRDYSQGLIAELPGPRDSAGQSPFWQGLGRHFFSGDPQACAAQHGPAWRSWVAALLPRQPIYASFLSIAAQSAIAQVDGPALLLREALEAAGLRYGHHVNVEDGGPVLEAQVNDLPLCAQARSLELCAEDSPMPVASTWWLAPTQQRCVIKLRGQAVGRVLAVAQADLERAQLQAGQLVWCAPAVPSANSPMA